MREVARRLGRKQRRRSHGSCGAMPPLEARSRVSRDDSAMACRASRSPPKQGELAINTALRAYALVPGPAVSWKGRRHGRRKDRRWANAWSPEQIARRLPVDFPDDDTMRISHEAIYQAVRGRGALRRELTACLRTGRPLRTPRCASTSPKAPISACTPPRRLPPRPSPPRCARAKRDFRAAALNVASRLASADLARSGRVRCPDRAPRAATDGGHIGPAACRHSR